MTPLTKTHTAGRDAKARLWRVPAANQLVVAGCKSLSNYWCILLSGPALGIAAGPATHAVATAGASRHMDVAWLECEWGSRIVVKISRRSFGS